MAAIKREINLRTREFAVAREFYWPRVFVTLGVLALFALVAAGSFFVHLFQLNLKTELSFLESSKEQLEQRVAPIEQMELEIEQMKVRLNVDQSYLARLLPWSDYLSRVEGVAARGGITINSISCPDPEQISIRGTGRSMRGVVLFVENLEAQDFLAGTAYTVIALQHNVFSFDVNARMTLEGDD